jgi:hypothetical protein
MTTCMMTLAPNELKTPLKGTAGGNERTGVPSYKVLFCFPPSLGVLLVSRINLT